MGSQERWPAFQAPTANTPQLGRHHESAERSCNKRSDSNGAPNILSNAPATSPSFREGMPAAHNNSCSHLTILCCASASSQPCTRPALVDSISAIHKPHARRSVSSFLHSVVKSLSLHSAFNRQNAVRLVHSPSSTDHNPCK
jgi:hypothetical protein